MNDSDYSDSREAELAHQLLRSARLDVPKEEARSRTLERGLAELQSAPRRWRTLAAAALAAAALGLGASAIYFGRSRPAEPIVVAEESPPKAPAITALPKALPPCPEVIVARGDDPMIDDWEQHDFRLLPRNGRGGEWAAFDDGTGTGQSLANVPLFPSAIPGRRGNSRRALHITGPKFETWGVVVGTNVASGACYDATVYKGIEFWAKGKGTLYVGFQMIDTQERKLGGFCAENCYNGHRKRVDLAGGWQHVTAPWADFVQLEPSGLVDFDPRRIRWLEFMVFAEDTPFDIWLDDLSFLPR
ncbi:MAG TPA: hypothetical protein VM686_36070 [Polyangiaceae bacterium]|nr:hypothetical protein [Polyangiaceae bacterium]